MVKNLESYLYASIVDIQGTIRALDTKVGFVFVVLSIPFTNLDNIYNTCYSLTTSSTQGSKLFYFSVVLICLFLLAWFLAFISTIRAIISIENPSGHIVNSTDHKGSFYCGGMYQVCFVDSVFNRESIRAKRDVKKHIKSFPLSNEQVNEELAFEQMKLAYIRDIKSIRQKWAYRFTTVWLFSGFAIYVLNKLTTVST